MAAYNDALDHTSIYQRAACDSEESDGEGGLGNLSRLIVRPPGQSGKAKRGQLCFDAAFECGNLGRADHITDLEYDLYVRPDTCRPRSRFWFNFTIENVKQDQRVILNIVNLAKETTLFDGDMTPLVRSTSRPKWQRIPRRLIFYHRSLVHKGRKILSIAFAFDREEDVYQFSAGASYSYSRLQKHLATWEKRAQAFATRQSIAQTTQKRRIDLVTIGDYNFKEKTEEVKEEHVITKIKPVDPKKRVVLIIARTHGGEPPSSFVCQGFLDYLLGSSEKAVALRNNIVLEVIPMLNPDGVFLGNQRSDLLGGDLNRSWNRATSYAHPALVAVNDLLKKLASEKTVQLDFIIDIHADISHEGVFVRGNSYDDVYRYGMFHFSPNASPTSVLDAHEHFPPPGPRFTSTTTHSVLRYLCHEFTQAVLPKFLGARIEAWRPEACFFNADSLLAGTARRALPSGSIDAYTLLVSLGGRRLSPRGPYIHYTEDAYTKIGKSLAKALCDYYRHIGVIPPRVGRSKKKDQRGRRRRRRPVIERDRSPSSSPERRVLAGRVLSPSLPKVSEPPLQALPARLSRRPILKSRPRTVLDDMEHILPIITGTAVKTPRLAVVDMSAYIRTPKSHVNLRLDKPQSKLSRPPRPSQPRFTSDEYDTHESDS